MTGATSWPPSRYVKPLTAGADGLPVYSDGYKLLGLVAACYRLPNGQPIVLDDWQHNLVISVLETFPPDHPKAGQLRFAQTAQAFVVIARQNGKTELAAIFAIYGLFRAAGSMVVGVASSVPQANILYDRVRNVMTADPSLASRFKRITGTRGMETTDNSSYLVKPSNQDAVQGLPVAIAVCDELHIMPHTLWSAMVSGTAAQTDGLVLGITTAGDDDSALLKHLYALAENESIDIGYWICERPEDKVPTKPGGDIDRERLGELLLYANPSYASGRMELEQLLTKVETLPHAEILRYHMNVFVASSGALLTAREWAASTFMRRTPMDKPVFCFMLSETKDWLTVHAAQVIDGHTYTETVLSIPYRGINQALKVVDALKVHSPARWVVDRWTLGGLAEILHKRDYDVSVASNGDRFQGSSHLYALIAKKTLSHDANPTLALQAATARRRNVGDSWKIDPQQSVVDVIYGLAFAALYAEIAAEDAPNQLFFGV